MKGSARESNPHLERRFLIRKERKFPGRPSHQDVCVFPGQPDRYHSKSEFPKQHPSEQMLAAKTNSALNLHRIRIHVGLQVLPRLAYTSA